jgi:outer membrane autotransporter protein
VVGIPAKTAALSGTGRAPAPVSFREDGADFSLEGPMTGLSAGDEEEGKKNGFWFSVNYTDLENDLVSTAYDGNNWLFMGGWDGMLTDKFIIGASVAYESLDLDTTFNAGNLDGSGFTFAPYFAYLITDSLVWDLITSFSALSYDSDRSAGTIAGSYNATRWIGSTSMSYYHFIKNWSLIGRLGYSFTYQDNSGFTETDGTTVPNQTTNIGAINIGGRVGYFIGKFEPYLAAYYIYDATLDDLIVAPTQAQPSNDRDELEVTLGFNFNPTNHIRLSLEGSHGFFRDDIDDTNILFNFRWEF